MIGCVEPCRIYVGQTHPIGSQGKMHLLALLRNARRAVERWKQTLKNQILLENYFLPGDLEAQNEIFVDHHNHHRFHESINNVTPADVYYGRYKAILKQRERIKRKTLETRSLNQIQRAA